MPDVLVRRTLPALGLALMAALAVAAPASAATVVNGDFETGDLSGWEQASTAGSWANYIGVTNPANGRLIAAPPEGLRAAVSGQNGPGRTFMYQDIELEEGQRHTLNLQVYYESAAALVSPDTLATNLSNQQYRIDVLRAGAPIDSVDAADILTTVFRTQPGDANPRAPFPISTDLTAFAGQTVRLRFAEVATDFFFSASTDDVRIVSVPDLNASPRTLSFGSRDVDDGAAVDQTSTLTNSSLEAVTLTGLTVSGDTTQFARLSGEPGDCTETTDLAVGAACDLRVRFDPTATGATAATLTIGSSAGDRHVALTGTGTQTELALSPDVLSFGSLDVDDGPTVSQTATVTNSGTEPIALSGLTVSGDDGHFERLTGDAGDCTTTTTLTAGLTCEVRVRFDPTATGAQAATLTIASDAADRTIALNGTGTQTDLTAAPDTLAFGTLDIDDAPTAGQTSTVTNTGTEPVDLSGLSLSGDGGEFERLAGDANDCTITTSLAAAESCDVRVRFDPASTGAKAATLTIASSSADRTVALTGTGTQSDLTPSPPTLDFGSLDIDDGPSVSQSSTLTNSGTEPVVLSGLTLSGDSAQFERMTGATGDCSGTTALAAGESCAVRVRFDPTGTGAKAATLTIASDTADRTIALTGAGIQTELSLSPAALAFGSMDIDDGPTGSRTSALTNSGTEPVVLSGLTLSGDSAQFERMTGATGDCSGTTTLAAGESCALRVRFDPTSTGAKAATLTIASDAADRTIAFGGTGSQVTEAVPLDPGTQQAPTLPLPGVVKPWTLTRLGAARVTRTTAGLRVRTGYVAACPAGGPACTGRLTLKMLRRSPTTGKLVPVFLTNRVALMTLSPGAQRRVSFTLNRRGAGLLRRLGSLTARLRGSVRAGASEPVVRSATMRISAPRPR